MAKLPSFRDTETMKRGSKSTSMKGAYVTAQIRPDTIKHKAALNSETAGQISTTAAANAAQADGMAGMSIFNAAVDIGDAYLKIRRSDEEASTETAYMEYRETMSQYNADKQVNSTMFDTATGKFGWETHEEEYLAQGKKVRAEIEKKYGIKAKDLRQKLDQSIRANDLAQVNSIQQFQVSRLAERTTANYNARKAKAVNIVEFKSALDWGWANGQIGSRDAYDAAIELKQRGFNTQNELDNIDNQSAEYTSGLLSMLRKDEKGMRLKFGDNLKKIETAAIDRVIEIEVGKMSAAVGSSPSRETLNAYYNSRLAKEPTQIGVVTDKQRLAVLKGIQGMKNQYAAGLATATSESKKTQRAQFHDANASATMDMRRTPDLLTEENGGLSIDKLTGDIDVDINAMQKPFKEYAPVSYEDDELDGFDRQFARESGGAGLDSNGNEYFNVNPLDSDVTALALEYAEATNGSIPESYLTPAIKNINGTDPIKSSVAAMNLASIVKTDPSGRMLDQITDSDAKDAVIEAISTGGGRIGLEEMKQKRARSVDQIDSNRKAWDANFNDTKPVNTTQIDYLNAKVKELGFEIDPPQAMVDSYLSIGRNEFTNGRGYGDWNRTAVVSTDKLLGKWAIEYIPDADGNLKPQWRENSYFAESGDSTGKSEVIKDRLATAEYEASLLTGKPISYEKAKTFQYRTSYAGTIRENGIAKKIWTVSRDGRIITDHTGMAIHVDKNSKSIMSDTLKSERKEKDALDAAKARARQADITADKHDASTLNLDNFMSATVKELREFGKGAMFGLTGGTEVTIAEMARGSGQTIVDIVNWIKARPEEVRGTRLENLTSKQMNQMARRETQSDTGMLGVSKADMDYHDFPESKRKYLGMTMHKIFVDKQNSLLQRKIISRAEFDANVASDRTVREAQGLIIPE